MRYASGLPLTTGAAGVYGTEQVYRLNSLYDPDFTGAGHQPYGYDQMIALYTKYLVSGVKVEVILTDPSADGIVVGMMVQPSTSTYTITGHGVDQIKEKPMAITRVINSTGRQIQRIVQYIPLAKLEGLSRSQWHNSQDDYGAATSANPTLNCWFRIAVGSVRGNAGDTVVARIQLTYYSKFYDRIVLAQS